MQRRRRLERRDGPVLCETDRLVSDGDGKRDRSRLVNRFVNGRAVDPNYVPVVVFDLGAVAGLVIMLARKMRREVAMSDGVLMFMAGAGLVDVCGRQGRRERQKRGDKAERRCASQGATSHARIIEGSAWTVNG
jgi:hypothetical protein